ncbi:glycoside hydrolase family 20 protein [Sphingobacterium corticibacter]|uniref:beta-N-acetylhexosaminidase n=1 Tax=Sphingobacterium corticibacter TaxID=2171749 RepID=A0A2T8HKX0_9SPHI|nr:family 20 glycosylhydrolase [Sphingobacterium corticibacter]PVH26055.1 beta-N-acetylhexosaminidase [Sphingobacterium corticibacter]
MKFSRVTLLSCFLLITWCNSRAQELHADLIPRPDKVVINEGALALDQAFPVFYSERFMELSQLLADIPNLQITSYELFKRVKKQQPAAIWILESKPSDNLRPNEYTLLINPAGITIKSPDVAGAMAGVQSLHQLSMLQDSDVLPFVEIQDKPRFAYRGLHLDVSRHFMPFEFLKKYIDVMALYKFNQFHWHLTDGAGWRLQINRYPELTKKAAWRPQAHFADWEKYGKRYVEQGTANAHGGFYTQAQARELVAYAAKKGINIIPEIEMPGHSEEVLAVYPELSCTGLPYTQNEFCVGNEQTFTFLKNVLDEVLDIFPSEYIHIGGDEADKSHWKTCPKCQALKEKLQVKTEEELQSYAVQQMDEYLQSKGRKMIGWDEILEGGLTEGATVMSWRGEEGGIEAANKGHDVIMTPQSHLYFDFYQFDPRTQPKAFGGYLPLERVYSYNPVSDKIAADKAKHILGAQANLWTEFMPNPQQVEYMAFPRALALAEINWTAQDQRDFPDFKRRLQKHYAILQDLQINYYRPSFDVLYDVVYDAAKKSNRIILTSEQFEPTIRYTIDGTEPDNQSPLYIAPIDLAVSATLKAASFLDSARMGPIKTVELDIHKAIGKTVQYNTKWNDRYAAQGEQTLVDGRKGGVSYQDGKWQGFTSDIELVIDLDRREEINRVAARFMQMPGPGVFFPGSIKVWISDNGKSYREAGSFVPHVDKHPEVLDIQSFEIKFDKPVMAKFIKFEAKNTKKAFLFIDEIVVD